jgi:hypothetical protein
MERIDFLCKVIRTSKTGEIKQIAPINSAQCPSAVDVECRWVNEARAMLLSMISGKREVKKAATGHGYASQKYVHRKESVGAEQLLGRSALPLNRVQQRRPQAHSASGRQLKPAATLFVFFVAEPTSPQGTGKAGVVVKTAAELVVLAPAKDAVGGFLRMIEDLVHVFHRPEAVKVDWVRNICSLQPMMKSNGWRPHLWEHGVSHLVRLLVCGIQKTLGETRDSDDGNAARGNRMSSAVAIHVVTENPVGLGWFKERIECDEIGFFANTPLIVVL